jgi:hypothetical protein
MPKYHWRVWIDKDIYVHECEGNHDLEPLIRAYGTKSTYDREAQHGHVKITHPLNSDMPFYAELRQDS